MVYFLKSWILVVPAYVMSCSRLEDKVFFIFRNVPSRNNETTWFEGKWIQLEDIILREVRKIQKDKGLLFSLICGR
jgi:hypothetical protein